MQRYIYVHQNQYDEESTQQQTSSGNTNSKHTAVSQPPSATVDEQTSSSHDAEWWSSEARGLIHYVALWSAPDISSAAVLRVLCLLKQSSVESASLLGSARTAVVWIASFIQDHGDWSTADFRKCRLLADCFEPNMQVAPDSFATSRVLIRRAVSQNPPREAGESRRVFPLDQLDLRMLPESLIDAAVVPTAALTATSTTSPKNAAGATFAQFESIFGSVDEAQEEWDLAEIVDGVGDLYHGDSGYALQLYAVEISGRGKFKGQKRPLIFSVILDAGCTQGSVLRALYPQMPRIARLIESLIFRPAKAYEACIVDREDNKRRYDEALRLMWGEMRRQNELENAALANDRYAEVSEINQVKSGYMRSIQRLQARSEIAKHEAAIATANGAVGENGQHSNHEAGRHFVEEKLQTLMSQAENLLRRCTTHGATSSVSASPRKAPAPRLPGPPKRKPATKSEDSSASSIKNSSGQPTDGETTQKVMVKDKMPNPAMTGFGSSIQALADEEPSFCSCLVS